MRNVHHPTTYHPTISCHTRHLQLSKPQSRGLGRTQHICPAPRGVRMRTGCEKGDPQTFQKIVSHLSPNRLNKHQRNCKSIPGTSGEAPLHGPGKSSALLLLTGLRAEGGSLRNQPSASRTVFAVQLSVRRHALHIPYSTAQSTVS